MRNEHVDDQLDLYALGALEPNEQTVVDEHLDRCARCRTHLEETKRLVMLLAWTPDQHEPPPALRDRILRNARQARQKTNVRWWQRLDPGAWAWSRPRRTLGFGMAMAAVLIALLGNTVLLRQRLVTAQTEATQQQAQAQTLRTQVAQQQQQLTKLETVAVQQQEVTKLLRVPGARLVVLASQAQNTAVGQLLVNRDGTEGYLVTDALPALPTDKDYQLWLIKDGQPISAGVFKVDQQGVANIVVNTTGQANGYQAVGISVEPAGGSPQPTTVVLLGQTTSL